MAKILVLFAHPVLEKSRIQIRMMRHAKHLKGILLHDLYEAYPNFDIDIKKEQELLLAHDVIILQHPFYWYSAPAIVKQWLDLVLEHHWAYGAGGNNLEGKWMMNAISSGGNREAYAQTGRNRFSVNHFLAPFDQTARLCQMKYLPPFVVHGTHKLKNDEIELAAVQYEQMLIALASDRLTENEWSEVDYMNDLIPLPQSVIN